MHKEDKRLLKEFEANARPVDKTVYIMLREILSVLKDIRKEMKKEVE